MLLFQPSLMIQSPRITITPSFTMIKSMATDRIASSPPRRAMSSAFEARVSLVFALASQTSNVSQRLLLDLANETAKYVLPKRFESQNLEEALMTAETTMPGKTGFDLNGASRSFNVLAEYLFGKNTTMEKMEMTTPVVTRKIQPYGEKMEMTTPVITKKTENQETWQMSFVMPSKYGANLPYPKDPSVRIKEVPKKVVAVVAFSGFVTDEDVKQRESKLRNALKNDTNFRVKEGASVEVAQYNPPFTLPFTRRNEIALEVERKDE
ncbi:heme-binding-like protein At3g10130, chloroplastic isoform X4 [Euphorbia lathyris]|uniref:heme-binding-like protein At3g10130, chloroplastic isoform X4 n=1 Tax=Euphorbia lathyris TaxID=212925 RepID=UPI0033143B5D